MQKTCYFIWVLASLYMEITFISEKQNVWEIALEGPRGFLLLVKQGNLT